MAWELIEDMADRELKDYRPIPHLLRHDFESLFYLSLWCAVTMPVTWDEMKKKKIYRLYIRGWESGTLRSIADRKKVLCGTVGQTDKIAFPPACEGLRPWFRDWNALLATAAMRLEHHRLEKYHADKTNDTLFDEETIGGTLSTESIRRVLSGGKVRRMKLVYAEPEEFVEPGTSRAGDEHLSSHVPAEFLGEVNDNREVEEVQEFEELKIPEESDVAENTSDDLLEEPSKVPRRPNVKERTKRVPKPRKVTTTRKTAEAKKSIADQKPTTARRVAETKKVKSITKTTRKIIASPIRGRETAGPATVTRRITRSMTKGVAARVSR
ncbi:hypothetical protein PHLCEN_2v3598 [Hermanssonia centrifuga]|uniref:Uncharacterized protein n=1 Tax=Hermanssonia centrifuga TaxID=98765 RepID=A0A2R6QEY5_9APHY|nr:hypothetical protein PHLCEN_2v3598 [Hermanssonia centrifuga]